MIVRTQQRLTLANRPAIGNWNVYSQAWWETNDTGLSVTVRDRLHRLFWGVSPSQATPCWHALAPCFVTGVGAARITRWKWNPTGGATGLGGLENLGVTDFSPTLWTTAGGYALPSQCCVAIGYRAPGGPHPQSRRSRFWIGPLVMSGLGGSGGMSFRMSTAVVDEISGSVLSSLQGLAALGWHLQVKSGIEPALSFNDATEIYVDDVIDVQRSRRADVRYQNRENI